MSKSDMSFTYNPYFKASPVDAGFKNFKSILVTNMDHLKNILNENLDKKMVAFDTETTGLTFFKDEIVGFSFSFEPYSAYYVPVRHKTGDNLPVECFNFFYEECLMKKTVLLFNALFDCYMLAAELPNKILDVQKLKIFEVQVLVYSADSDVPRKNLKWASQHYLGRKSPTFDETLIQLNSSEIQTAYKYLAELNDKVSLKKQEISDLTSSFNLAENSLDSSAYKNQVKQLKSLDKEVMAYEKEIKKTNKDIVRLSTKAPKDVTFADLNPVDATYYASCDAANTLALFNVLYPILEKECKFTITLDNKLAKASLFYANCPIYIDNQKMQTLVASLNEKINVLNSEIFEFFGYPLNLDCLAYDTRIDIEYDGKQENNIKILDLFRIMKFHKYVKVKTPIGFKLILGLHDVGKKRSYEIELEDRELPLVCSKNELLLTLLESGEYSFVKAKDLKANDYILGKEDTIDTEKFKRALMQIPGGKHALSIG